MLEFILKEIVVIPSIVNVLICVLLLSGSFIDNLIDKNIGLILISIVLVFNILSFFSAIIRKRKSLKIDNLVNDLLKAYDIKSDKVLVSDKLKQLLEETGKHKQKNTALSTHNDFLLQLLNQKAYELRNINTILDYTNSYNLSNIKELIKKNNKNSIKDIYALTKIAMSYETHYDDFDKELIPNFKGAKVAIVNNNILENFLLECILKQYGINTSVFCKIDDFSSYDCVIVSSEFDYNTSKCIVISEYENKENYIKRPFDKIKLKNILTKILDTNYNFSQSDELKSDVLIYLDSEIKNNHLLHLVNKHSSINKAVDSVSAFKEELNNNYKIIAIGYTAILYDFDSIKSILYSIKSNHPETFIILFSSNATIKKNVDFADLIIKDASESKLIEVIKKHL